MIYEWKMDGDVRNFGDALPELIMEEEIFQKWSEDETFMFFPIGSVICNEMMEESLDLGFEPVFSNCGWRGEPLDRSLVDRCLFVGARGPHTQAELARHDVNVKVTGDPAYQVRAVVPRGKPNALAAVVRHIKDDVDYGEQEMQYLGADGVFTPVVETKDDMVDLIEIISGARFVLAGSLHAAIIAHAYEVPFAPLDSEYVDCPPKWGDWLAYVGIEEPVFCRDINEGRTWYNSVKSKIITV